MGQENYNIDEIYRVELMRTSDSVKRMDADQNINIYFMLDYFDFMKTEKLAKSSDGYIELCENNRFDDIKEQNILEKQIFVSKKKIGIFGMQRADEAARREDIFAVIPSGTEVSDHPFLCVAQIYLIDYKWKLKGAVQIDRVEEQLVQYREMIENKLRECLEKEDIFRVFHTVTGEDFCAVIRSDSISRLYHALASLKEIRDGQTGKKLFFTYSNIGIECCRAGNNALRMTQKQIIQNRQIHFALRFRADGAVIRKFAHLIENAGTGSIEREAGLFGRYDLTLNVNMEEMVGLYPYLCGDKMGLFARERPVTKDDADEFVRKWVSRISRCLIKEIPGAGGKELLQETVRELILGNIRTLNVRVLVALQQQGNLQPVGINQEDFAYIHRQREELYRTYDEFKQNYRHCFLLHRRRYGELKNRLERLIELYDNLAYEADSHANWRIGSQYLKSLFENMNSYMEQVVEAGEDGNEEAIRQFLSDFHMFLDAYEKFLQLLQGTNQHTIQAPQYGAVTPIEGQKFLIAYREFVSMMHEEYREADWENGPAGICREKRNPVSVIVYPDSSREKVEIQSIFRWDYIYDRNRSSDLTGISLCRIPMFEYFMRPYDLIPLLSHEICHQMLVIDRRERNRLLINAIFKELGKEAGYFVQVYGRTDIDSVEFDMMGQLFCECFSEAMTEHYQGWENYVLGHLMEDIKAFTVRSLKNGDRDQKYGYGIMEWDSVAKELETLICEIFEERFAKDISEDEEKKCRAGNEEKYRLLDCLQKINEAYGQLPNGVRAKDAREAGDFLGDVDHLCGELLTASDEILLPEEVNGIRPEFLRNMTAKDAEKLMLEEGIRIQEEIFALQKEEYTELTTKSIVKYYLSVTERILDAKMNAYYVCRPGAGVKKEDLMNCIAEKMEKGFREEFLDGDACLLYNGNRIKKAVYLEMLDGKRSAAHYGRALEHMSEKTVRNLADREYQIYNETCADLMMCQYLGFTGFGYFRMAVVESGNLYNYKTEKATDMFAQKRFWTVLAVLLAEGRPETKKIGFEEYYLISLEKMHTQIEKYVESELEQAYKNLKNEIEIQYTEKTERERELRNLEKFHKVQKEQKEEYLIKIKSAKAIEWKGSIWQLVCSNASGPKGMTFKTKELLRREINLYRRVYLTLEAWGKILAKTYRKPEAEDLTQNLIYIEKEYWDHMKQIYDGAGSVKVTRHPLVEKVVRFYNNEKAQSESNNQKMIDTLRFVQDFYYYSRFKNWQGENPADEEIC